MLNMMPRGAKLNYLRKILNFAILWYVWSNAERGQTEKLL